MSCILISTHIKLYHGIDQNFKICVFSGHLHSKLIFCPWPPKAHVHLKMKIPFIQSTRVCKQLKVSLMFKRPSAMSSLRPKANSGVSPCKSCLKTPSDIFPTHNDRAFNAHSKWNQEEILRRNQTRVRPKPSRENKILQLHSQHPHLMVTWCKL